MTNNDTGGYEPPKHASTQFEELDPDLNVRMEYIDGKPEAVLAVIHDPEYRPIPDDEMELRKAPDIADELCIDCFTGTDEEVDFRSETSMVNLTYTFAIALAGMTAKVPILRAGLCPNGNSSTMPWETASTSTSTPMPRPSEK